MRLGLFGGTFDPPHAGHLIAAQDARTILQLDTVIFIPAAIPPHKRNEGITAAGTRLAMLRAAATEDPAFQVDDLELHRTGPSWTVDTVRAYRERLPDAEILLLMGSDQYAEFQSWREPDMIRELATIAVLTREGGTQEPTDGVVTARVTRIDISSTDIRRRVRAGEPIRYLVPTAVEALIRLNRLYTEPAHTEPTGPAATGPA